MDRYPLLIFALFVCQQAVFAECRTDRSGDVYCGRGQCVQNKNGEVFCSRYVFGDAVVDKYGSVVCGKGKCLPGRDFNHYYCSSIENGGADIDKQGNVKCYGGCEQASVSMCESVEGMQADNSSARSGKEEKPSLR